MLLPVDPHCHSKGKCASPPSTTGEVEASIHYVTGFKLRQASSYYYHAPIRAASIEPASGSMAGGTRVVVSLLSDAPSVIEAHGGAYAWLWRFFIKRPRWSTLHRSHVCRTSRRGVVSVSLTANGVDFEERVGTFAYYQELEVNDAAPSNATPRGRRKSAGARTIFGPGDALSIRRLLLLINTPRQRKSSAMSPPHASGLARVTCRRMESTSWTVLGCTMKQQGPRRRRTTGFCGAW